MKKNADTLIKIGFILALIVLTTIGVLSYHSLSEFADTAQLVQHSHEVIETLETLDTRVADVEASARGFVLAGEGSYLDQYDTALSQVTQSLTDLRTLTVDTARQHQVERIDRLCSDKLAFSRQVIDIRKQKGFGPASELLLSGRALQLTENLRNAINEMGSGAKKTLTQRSAAAQVRGRTAIRVLIVGALFGFSMLYFVYYQLNREIKRRKRAEDEVRQFNQDLERRIDQRTNELTVLNKELAQSNSELARVSHLKSEFLARMSHELRTPMNAIVGFSDLLAEESEGPLNVDYRRFVQHIQEGARHLLQLINDVLDLSKIEAGKLEISSTRFQALEALEEVLTIIRPLALIKRIQIQNELLPDVHILADRTRFKQILYNLLSNAVKFTPEQGKVWIQAKPVGRDTLFIIGDTGIGIPKEEHENIFSEFHQVGTNGAGTGEGTGLGLAITRRLIEMHGGTISVESEPGKGSCFSFNLPTSSQVENAAGR